MPSADDEIAMLRSQVARMALRITELERHLAATAPRRAVRHASIWDFSVYEVVPDPGWVALDRDAAVELLRGLAEIDHWRPWTTVLERRGPR